MTAPHAENVFDQYCLETALSTDMREKDHTSSDRVYSSAMIDPDRLRQALARRGLSQGAVERALGVSRGYLSHVIAGRRRPPLETALRIAEALDVAPDVIMVDGAGVRGVNLSVIPGGAPRSDRYPSRGTVLRMARAKGVDAAAIAELESIRLKSDGDPGITFWLSRLQELQSAARTLDELVDGRDVFDVAPLGGDES